ncbi:hypothetical protein K8R03_01885 [Candidatus Kaiserbacteria bacterium]|nr:hypothetical protein [Candidatus Kaiserbacteria bacterium]
MPENKPPRIFNFPTILTPEEAAHIRAKNEAAAPAHPDLPKARVRIEGTDMIPADEANFAFGEALEAAKPRADKILIETLNCDSAQTEAKRNIFYETRYPYDLVQIILSASDADIQADPTYYRAAALAFLHPKSEDSF